MQAACSKDIFFTSGLHSDTYGNFRSLQHPKPPGVFVRAGLPLRDRVWMLWSADRALFSLRSGHQLKASYLTEREDGVMCLRRGFAINPGKRPGG